MIAGCDMNLCDNSLNIKLFVSSPVTQKSFKGIPSRLEASGIILRISSLPLFYVA